MPDAGITSGRPAHHPGFRAGHLVASIPALGVLAYVAIFSVTRLANPNLPVSTIFFSDLDRYFFPSFTFLRESLLAGEFPLWNPYQMAGIPFFALHSPGVAYPPLLALALLPPRIAITMDVIGHLALAGVFASLLARRLGLGNAASLAVGLAFVGSHPLIEAVDSTAVLSTFVWLPAALWATEGLMQQRDARRTALLALILALGFLGGYAQGALYLAQAVGLYAFFRAAASLRGVERWSFLALFGAAGMLAAGLVAVQLLPTVEYVWDSARNTSRLTLEQASWGYPMNASLGEILSGRARSYFGVPLLIGPLAVAAVAFSRFRREALFFLCLLLLTYDFMRGLDGYVFSVYYQLPLGDLFRIPLRMSFVYQLAAAMLIGIGGDALLSRLRLGSPVAVVAGLLLVGLVGADVYLRNLPSRSFAPLVAPEVLSGPREIAALGDYSGHDRIFIEPGGVPWKAGTIHGFFAVPDYEPLLPERYVRFFEVPRGQLWHGYLSTVRGKARQSPEVLDLLSVRYYLNAGHVPGVQRAVGGRAVAGLGIPFYVREQAVPRTYVIHQLIRTSSDSEALEIIRSGRFNPLREAVVQGDVGPVQPLVEGAREHSRIQRYRPRQVEIEASCDTTCLVVLTDLYDPNWQATLDGAPVDVTPVNFLFRGVLVTPGTHRIAFEYRPMSFRLGAGISGAALALVAALLIRWPPGASVGETRA